MIIIIRIDTLFEEQFPVLFLVSTSYFNFSLIASGINMNRNYVR